jgi:hypothetical protein
LKQFVLGFAQLKIPGAAWLRGIPAAVRNNEATSTAASAASSIASAAVPEILACGDLLMTHPPAWFRTHIPLPRALYPRTLVIAGTMSLLQGITPQSSDGTITFAETKLPDPITDAKEDAQPSDEVFVPSSSSSVVSGGPCGSQHMSFHAQHSLLLTHPGVIAATMRFLETGRAD